MTLYDKGEWGVHKVMTLPYLGGRGYPPNLYDLICEQPFIIPRGRRKGSIYKCCHAEKSGGLKYSVFFRGRVMLQDPSDKVRRYNNISSLFFQVKEGDE